MAQPAENNKSIQPNQKRVGGMPVARSGCGAAHKPSLYPRNLPANAL